MPRSFSPQLRAIASLGILLVAVIVSAFGPSPQPTSQRLLALPTPAEGIAQAWLDHHFQASSSTTLADAQLPGGSLRSDVHGAFSATGYSLTTAPDGSPGFVPQSETSDLTFHTYSIGLSGGSNTRGLARAVLVEAQGFIVAGRFEKAGNVASNNIVRWDGIQWQQMGAGVNGTVFALARVGTDLYAGGDFPGGLARWDGTQWQQVGTLSGPVYALTAWNGMLVAGGDFATSSGGTKVFLARWDGAQWQKFGNGLSGPVHALTSTNTDLYAGGNFSRSGATTVNGIGRWDGAQWNALGSGTNGIVHAIAVQNGVVYAGGTFTIAGGRSIALIAQWNGTAWSTLGTGLSATPATGRIPAVLTLAADGNTLYVGGDFDQAGGQNANNIARWNGTWSVLGSGTAPVFAVAPHTNGVYATTSSANELSVHGIASWNGSQWLPIEEGPCANILALATIGQDVYAGGSWFYTAEGLTRGIARWDGTRWHALEQGLNGTVNALAVLDGMVYAGGVFTLGNGSPGYGIARWNGTRWDGLGTGVAGITNVGSRTTDVRVLAVYLNTLVIGGNFTSVSSVTAESVAQWDGTQWHALRTVNPYFRGAAIALAASGDSLYASFYGQDANGYYTSRFQYLTQNRWDQVPGNFRDGPSYISYHQSNLYAVAAEGSTGYKKVLLRRNGATWEPIDLNLTPDCLLSTETDLFLGGSLYGPVNSFYTSYNLARWNGTRLEPETGLQGGPVIAMALGQVALHPGSSPVPALFIAMKGFGGSRFAYATGPSIVNVSREDAPSLPDASLRLDVLGHGTDRPQVRLVGLLPGETARVLVYDVHGRAVHHFNGTGARAEMPRLAPGVYLLRATVGSRTAKARLTVR